MSFRIKEVRKQVGMSQSELARKSGVSRTTIYNLETDDDIETTTGTIARIAKALGVGVEQIFFAPDE